MRLRHYQQRSVDSVNKLLSDGARSVCLVSPVGSGKTVMGKALCEGMRAGWIVHTNALVAHAR
jgi:superfamily II DNA or RNA helicase